ncbi:AAEL012756-PA [Aedes aegypti]|uniref:AAEL012756-PA n=1 Tax=Aedes aegypti TaxID=7159 RepID=Q16L61_AEDAE|nr:AAEL012756-PA [Aedes aegypti]
MNPLQSVRSCPVPIDQSSNKARTVMKRHLELLPSNCSHSALLHIVTKQHAGCKTLN